MPLPLSLSRGNENFRKHIDLLFLLATVMDQMRHVPHRLWYLNAWSLGFDFAKESTSLEVGRETLKHHANLIHFLCLMLVVEMWAFCFQLLLPYLLLGTMSLGLDGGSHSPGTVSPNKFFLQQLPWSWYFIIVTRKVTNKVHNSEKKYKCHTKKSEIYFTHLKTWFKSL